MPKNYGGVICTQNPIFSSEEGDFLEVVGVNWNQ
jgi:hypothetical protein